MPRRAGRNHGAVKAFESFGLDARILQTLADEGFTAPTLVQEKVLPLALEGKSVLGQSHAKDYPVSKV